MINLAGAKQRAGDRELAGQPYEHARTRRKQAGDERRASGNGIEKDRHGSAREIRVGNITDPLTSGAGANTVESLSIGISRNTFWLSRLASVGG